MAIELEKTSSPNLPLDIIKVILSKSSSIKSLLRFKAVSKSWNATISDPVFVRNHLQSSNSPDNLLVSTRRNSTDRGFTVVKFEGGKIHDEQVLENIPNGFDVIICECNGMLLLTSNSHHYSKYALWNPSTRQEMCFEFPYAFNEFDIVNLGICYDPIINDFKVVVIADEYCAVYSCKNKSWTKKKLGTRYYDINVGCYGIFVDGATYWVLRDKNCKTLQIVYFDPTTDELKTLQKPKELNGDVDECLFMSVACLKGSLCFYCTYRDENKVRIWMKEKGNIAVESNCSWKEFITIENCQTSMTTTIWWSEPMCFVENKIVIKVAGDVFVYYSPSENTVEEFQDISRGRLVPYRKSLYFPQA